MTPIQDTTLCASPERNHGLLSAKNAEALGWWIALLPWSYSGKRSNTKKRTLTFARPKWGAEANPVKDTYRKLYGKSANRCLREDSLRLE
jgi:hypothetical protein